MLDVIIIDDEANAIELISSILLDKYPDVNIVGKAQSPFEAIKLINQLKPDLVFLDIEMPEANGFELLEALPERKFETIFITAYDKYALKAFRYSAMDYLLKPIDVDDFSDAVAKAIRKIMHGEPRLDNYKILFDNLKAEQPFKVALPSNKGVEYVEIKEIVRIVADGRYSSIHLEDGRSITVTKLLNELINIVDNKFFFRTHKSHFINLNFVRMFVKSEGNYIEMKDGSHVSISRNRKDEFLDRMNTLIKRDNKQE